MSGLPPPGLYAITDTALTRERGLRACVEGALRGGAVIVQYRDKISDPATRLREARGLRDLCAEYCVPLIVNDDVALASAAGAAGVHLGRDDGDVSDARRRLGADAIIGVSCYHELARAQTAAAQGADYIAFGRFFASRTKPGHPLATPELLREAVATLALPIAAIGGITADNAHELVAAGAHWLAVIHGLWAGQDTESSARRIASAFP